MIYSIRVNKQLYHSIPLLVRMLGFDYEQDSVNRPQGLPLWQFLIGVSGSGEFTIDNKHYILRPGQAVFLPPHIPHSYHSSGGKWIVHFIGFNGNSCQKLLLDLHLHRAGLYQLKYKEHCFQHLENFRSILDDELPDKNRVLSKELYSFLLDMSRSHYVENVEQPGQSELISEIILYLENHYAEDISLSVLSDQFSRTPEYLCSLFRKEKGETIIKCLTRIRIGHARWMILENPELTAREIGERCGFRSPSYFGKVFKDYTGASPQDYIRSTWS